MNASAGEICLICFMMVGNGIIKSILSLTNKYNPAGETERCWQGCHQSHLGSCSGFWNIFFWCGASCKIIFCDRWWPHHQTRHQISEQLDTHFYGLTSSSHHLQCEIEKFVCHSVSLISWLVILVWSEFFPTVQSEWCDHRFMLLSNYLGGWRD